MIKIKNGKCKFCDTYVKDLDHYVSHLESHHDTEIIDGMDGWQFLYFLQTGKTKGSCVVCHGETSWNPSTKKYNRYCSEKCKEKYREIFKKRMITTYGKVTLLDDPEQQRKMLEHRSISGTYTWSDRVHTSTYVGSYELSFLEFLDKVLEYDPEDVMTPSPHTYYYNYDHERKFYIPDIYIASLNLEIEIKDGGNNPNMHHKIQDVDKEKEKLKDKVMETNGAINYVKIVNKENAKFFRMLDLLKEKFLTQSKKAIILL